MYYTSPALTHYWGKVLKTFENDPDADVNEAEFDFVKRKKISSDPSQITWTQVIKKNRDISVALAHCMFYRPCLSENLKMGEKKSQDNEAKPCWERIQKLLVNNK